MKWMPLSFAINYTWNICCVIFIFIFLGRDPLAGLNHWKDINAVAGLLRVYFRELQDPLFSSAQYQDFIKASCKFNKVIIVLSYKNSHCIINFCWCHARSGVIANSCNTPLVFKVLVCQGGTFNLNGVWYLFSGEI